MIFEVPFITVLVIFQFHSSIQFGFIGEEFLIQYDEHELVSNLGYLLHDFRSDLPEN